jgi:hypothetical protein
MRGIDDSPGHAACSLSARVATLTVVMPDGLMEP